MFTSSRWQRFPVKPSERGQGWFDRGAWSGKGVGFGSYDRVWPAEVHCRCPCGHPGRTPTPERGLAHRALGPIVPCVRDYEVSG